MATTFLDLPPELVHAVLDCLDEQDILVVRTTCSTLATMGADHMLSTVLAVYKRDRLQRLGDIAEHETLAKHVKHFYFQADRLREPPLSFEDWNHEREDAIPWTQYNITHEISDFDPHSERGMRAFTRARNRYNRIKKGKHSMSELRKAYETYVAVVEDQAVIAETKFDLSCLTRFLQSCRNLDKVTLAMCHGLSGSKNATRMAFAETMMHPYGDSTVMEQGVHQFWVFLEALRASQRHIRHFTATELSHRVLHDWWQDKPVGPIIAHMMAGLREIRLSFSCHEDELDPDERIDIEADIEGHHSKGLLAHWLSLGDELRVLKLQLYSVEIDIPNGHVIHALAHKTWPKLRELGLSQFSTTEDYLVDLLIRHARSLRRLTLSYLYLTQGDWGSLLNRIAGKLPKLKKIKLRGMFRCQIFFFDLGEPEFSGGTSAFRDGIENYVLHGGEPIDLEELINSAESDDDILFGEQQQPGEAPFLLHYVGTRFRPGRMDDEDAGYTTDGSAISYGSDGFDGVM